MGIVQTLAATVRAVLRPLGIDIVRYRPASANTDYLIPDDFSLEEIEFFNSVAPYTLTSPERVKALVEALEYIVRNNIPGDIVECGVWQGGSMMAAALTLKRLGDTSRTIYLCDVFHTGWPKPADIDVDHLGVSAAEAWELVKSEGREFPTPDIEMIRERMLSTGYPEDKLEFVVGKVQDTLPKQGPETIALVRLDTDLYESTLHEITHLYPRVSSGGVLIIDDYGGWKGSRIATDEYLAEHKPRVFLHRIDSTGRLIVKP